jgi:histone demethylase JARID1
MKPATENTSWLKRGLTEMKHREMKERSLVRLKKVKEEPVPSTDAGDELQCVFCNCYSYLSYIGCPCTDKVACLDHISEVSVWGDFSV